MLKKETVNLKGSGRAQLLFLPAPRIGASWSFDPILSNPLASPPGHRPRRCISYSEVLPTLTSDVVRAASSLELHNKYEQILKMEDGNQNPRIQPHEPCQIPTQWKNAPQVTPAALTWIHNIFVQLFCAVIPACGRKKQKEVKWQINRGYRGPDWESLGVEHGKQKSQKEPRRLVNGPCGTFAS